MLPGPNVRRDPEIPPATIDCDPMKRSTTIDICRALLFILMMNTHALTIAGVGRAHWLRSDFWLPNGWATVSFVVLSGFGVGYIYAGRAAGRTRTAAVQGRAFEILVVMLASNLFFAALREIAQGNSGIVASPSWWIGFVTLETPWTISGVLLPTALVLLIFPVLAPPIARAPWFMLAVLAAARIGSDLLAGVATASSMGESLPVRLFLTEGLGGFPVLPFVLNGALGIWLGNLCHQNKLHWRAMMGALLLLQVVLYFGATYFRDALGPAGLAYLSPFGSLGKFAWMFLIAYAVSLVGGRFLTNMLALIGQYALGSFIMHRVFLQGMAMVLGTAAFGFMTAELRYATLCISTLFLTWALCLSRSQTEWVDSSLRRLAL